MGGDFSKVLNTICPIWYIKTGEDYILIDTSFSLKDMDKLGIKDLCKRDDNEKPENCFKFNNIDINAVKKVIITHAHTDHIGNLEMFKNAEFFIHRNEKYNFASIVVKHSCVFQNKVQLKKRF